MMIKFNQEQPIYLQITHYIKQQIIKGTLKSGEKIDSVRESSEYLQVNPNTVQKAYVELEREGLIYVQRGKGYFIVEDKERLEKLKIEYAQKSMQRFVDEMKAIGLEKEAIYTLLEGVL